MFLTDNDVTLLDKNSPLFSPLASSIEEKCGKIQDRLIESPATTCRTTQQDHHQLSRSVISRVKNIRLKIHCIYNNFVCQLWLYLYKIPWYVHSSQSQCYNITDWLTVSRAIYLGVRHPSGTHDNFFLIIFRQVLGLLIWGALSDKRVGSVVYSCCWAWPVQSFLGPSPMGLMTIFYCLKFETPPIWRARFPYLFPLATGWPRHWVPFSSPLMTHSAAVEVFEPPPHGVPYAHYKSKCEMSVFSNLVFAVRFLVQYSANSSDLLCNSQFISKVTLAKLVVLIYEKIWTMPFYEFFSVRKK
jgi:hypothetical protein